MLLPVAGETFNDKYEVRSILGQGGYAVVYRALQLGADRDVALKILEPGADGYAQVIESRFWREVKIVSRLTDPHTVTLYDFGRSSNGLLFMAFEYIPGEDLQRVMGRAGRMTEQQTVHVLKQLLASLREAHEHGLLHRDLKPANIRVQEFRGDPLSIKLLDFGIAKAASGRGSTEITEIGEWVGTPQYMSPEQIYGDDLTPASDLYAVGLIGWQMLTGESFVSGDQVGELFRQHASRKPRKLPLDLAISPRLRGVIERLVLHDAKARPQTADEVLRELRSIEDRPEPGAKSEPTLREVVLPEELLRPDNDTTDRDLGPSVLDDLPTRKKMEAQRRPPRSAREIRQRNTMLIAGVITAVALVALAAILLTGDDRDDVGYRPEEQIAAPSAAYEIHEESADENMPLALLEARQSLDDAVTAARDKNRIEGSGCGLPAEVGFSTERASIDGVFHEWLTYVPPGYDPEKRHPMILFFHSMRTASLESFIHETRLKEIADEHGVVILAPRALKNPRQHIAARPWVDHRNRNHVYTEIHVVQNALRSVTEDLCIDPERLYIHGHGSGGAMAIRFPCVVPVSAIAVTSFRLPTDGDWCPYLQPTPTIWFNGTRDGWYPVGGGNDGRDRVSFIDNTNLLKERNACKGPSKQQRDEIHYVCESWSSCEAPVTACLHEYGHDWPNAQYAQHEQFFVEMKSGPPVQFPMEEMIWDFFAEHGVALSPPADIVIEE